ncbi:hypothetical protein N7509_001338 [Penicillium cosmopolitanum]|uniref:Uncharacterized protein n=1 Tax=Penicillium cosmopolitanum TaxID=1131564 RepID=A0A9W9WC18_9EURO|nr:uncharacterized protein N7509_001338 [Penicillium cosmopolitanum]KAJ5414711.1 hypothetical protein N7509_001338 [Penicillium cosmopolitanum]
MEEPPANLPAFQVGLGACLRSVSAPPRLGMNERKNYPKDIAGFHGGDKTTKPACKARPANRAGDPFVTPTDNPHPNRQRRVPTLFGKGEKTNEARIRILEAHVLALIEENQTLQRRLSIQEEVTNTCGSSPVTCGRTSTSDEAIKRSILAYVNNRIDRLQNRIFVRMERRDGLVYAQISQLAFHVAVIGQGLNNLARYVANFARSVVHSIAQTA